MSSPTVSVLMPVFNGSKYLKEAVESILRQNYGDFELLIINDGSTDDSVQIVSSYDDPRIRLVHNDTNTGLVATLNKGLEISRGRFVARLDCDDVCLPRRLEKQVELMVNQPRVAICGTGIELFGGKKQIKRYPTDDARIRARMLFESLLRIPRSCCGGLSFSGRGCDILTRLSMRKIMISGHASRPHINSPTLNKFSHDTAFTVAKSASGNMSNNARWLIESGEGCWSSLVLMPPTRTSGFFPKSLVGGQILRENFLMRQNSFLINSLV